VYDKADWPWGATSAIVADGCYAGGGINYIAQRMGLR